MEDFTVSCYIGGKHVSGLPLLKKNKRTCRVLVRCGQTGKLKQITRKIDQHKVRFHPPAKAKINKAL